MLGKSSGGFICQYMSRYLTSASWPTNCADSLKSAAMTVSDGLGGVLYESGEDGRSKAPRQLEPRRRGVDGDFKIVGTGK